VLLIAAAVVIPAAIARLVTHSFAATIVVATAVGVASSVVGLFASFHVNVPSGPTIVLAGAIAFALVFTATAGTARARLSGARRRANGIAPTSV
jgi:ABC-type Mn2+/Zn2+ transport system permease subunit